jgi:hypothetical protein
VWIAAMRGGGGVSTARLPRSGQARGVPWWGKMLQFCHGSRQSRHTRKQVVVTGAGMGTWWRPGAFEP